MQPRGCTAARISTPSEAAVRLRSTSSGSADRLFAWGLVALPFSTPAIAWDDRDSLKMATEELTREELMRILDMKRS